MVKGSTVILLFFTLHLPLPLFLSLPIIPLFLFFLCVFLHECRHPLQGNIAFKAIIVEQNKLQLKVLYEI
jgi:hypothetical protein